MICELWKCHRKLDVIHYDKQELALFGIMYQQVKRNLPIKEIFTNCNNIFLWHESEDINEKRFFPKFQLIPILRFQVKHDYACFIAPIDYIVLF